MDELYETEEQTQQLDDLFAEEWEQWQNEIEEIEIISARQIVL